MRQDIPHSQPSLEWFVGFLRFVGSLLFMALVIGLVVLLTSIPDCELVGSLGDYESDCSNRDPYYLFAVSSALSGVLLIVMLFAVAHGLSVLGRIEHYLAPADEPPPVTEDEE